MPKAPLYRARGRTSRSRDTRSRILQATRELLDEGGFHESTVEEVGDRAGVSRATVYQHFPTRLDLVDAICDTFAENPALLAVRESVRLPDLDGALAETIANSVRFWSSEDEVLAQLYGATAVDPAAHDLVDRQLGDRRGEMARLVSRLDEAKRLGRGTGRREALSYLMVATSFGTYRELRQERLSDAKLTAMLQDMARTLLVDS
jgi:AcrR family transcriptional regulator